MKKIKILILIILISIIGLSIFSSYQYYRIKHAKIKVELIDNLDIEVYSEVKLKDLIKPSSVSIKKIDEKHLIITPLNFSFWFLAPRYKKHFLFPTKSLIIILAEFKFILDTPRT